MGCGCSIPDVCFGYLFSSHCNVAIHLFIEGLDGTYGTIIYVLILAINIPNEKAQIFSQINFGNRNSNFVR